MKNNYKNHYANHYEIWINGNHIATTEKRKINHYPYTVEVTYANELTGISKSYYYKTEKAANTQITKFQNRIFKVYDMHF